MPQRGFDVCLRNLICEHASTYSNHGQVICTIGECVLVLGRTDAAVRLQFWAMSHLLGQRDVYLETHWHIGLSEIHKAISPIEMVMIDID
jgi:hypothetical protein